MNRQIDKNLVKERFSKAIDTYTHEAIVQQYIAEQMCNILKKFIPSEKKGAVLEIGCGTGLFTRLFLKENTIDKLTINDICDISKLGLEDLLGEKVSFLSGDAERLNLPDNQDMIVSCSAIQWFDNPVVFLKNCKEKLTDSGILAISSFAPENFKEIKEISSCTLQYISIDKIKKSLRNYYDIIYSSEENIYLYFDSPKEVLKHLKKTGVNGIRKEKWTRKNLNEFCLKYKKHFSTTNDKVRLTYNPIYLICKKKQNEKE